MAAFELEVFKFMESLVKEENIPCDWYVELLPFIIISPDHTNNYRVSLTGVHAFYSENMFELAAASVDQLQQTHPELAAQMEVVRPSSSSNQGDTLASLRVPTAKGAIVQKKAASLWPYKLVTQIVERLLAKYPPPTFNLQTNTPVTQLTRHESGNRWVAITPRGSITARHVLLATNGYTSHLLPAFADLIVPVRGQVGALLPPRPKVDAGEGSPAKLNHSYVFAADPEIETGATAPRDDYLVQRPMPTGELIYGGGRRFARSLGVGEWRDDELEPQVAEYLRKSLAPVLDLTPSSANSDEKTPTRELNASFEWTGVMGYSRDQHAWVGPVPESMGGGEGLWICAGYTGHGMPAAALSAREVVRQILTTNGAEIEGDAKDGVKLPREFMVSEKRIIEARTLPPLTQGWEATNFATLITSTGLLDQRKAS